MGEKSMMNNSKRWLELGLVQYLNKDNKFVRTDKTKEKEFRFPKAENCGKVNICGEPREGKY